MLALLLAATIASTAQDVTLTTCGGNLYAPGPTIGGTLYIGACGGSTQRVTIHETYRKDGTFPNECLYGDITWAYVDGDGTFVTDTTEFGACNTLVGVPKPASTDYAFAATFEGIDSRGDSYTGTLEGPDRYYRVCTRTCGNKLTTTGLELTLHYDLPPLAAKED